MLPTISEIKTGQSIKWHCYTEVLQEYHSRSRKNSRIHIRNWMFKLDFFPSKQIEISHELKLELLMHA